MKLSDTQSLILREAALHPDGIAAPPAGPPPAPRTAVAKALLNAELLAPAEADETRHACLGWRLDSGLVILHITEAGCLAIGLAHAAAAETGAAGHGAALAAVVVIGGERPANRYAMPYSKAGPAADAHSVLGDERRVAAEGPLLPIIGGQHLARAAEHGARGAGGFPLESGQCRR